MHNLSILNVFFKEKLRHYKLLKYFLIIIFFISFSTVSFSKNIDTFNFPKHIQYVIFKNNKIVASSVFSCKKLAKGYCLNFKNFAGFGLNSDNRFISFLNTDYQLEASMITKGREVLSEFRILTTFETKTNGSLLGGPIVKIKKNMQQEPKIVELTFNSDKIMDFLSSFILLSQKMNSEKVTLQERYLYVIPNSMYVMDCTYIGQDNCIFKNKKIFVTKYQLNRHIDSENINFAEFYIHKDSEGFYFPVKIKVFDSVEYIFKVRKIVR